VKSLNCWDWLALAVAMHELIIDHRHHGTVPVLLLDTHFRSFPLTALRLQIRSAHLYPDGSSRRVLNSLDINDETGPRARSIFRELGIVVKLQAHQRVGDSLHMVQTVEVMVTWRARGVDELPLGLNLTHLVFPLEEVLVCLDWIDDHVVQ
jgi:hypothetical protein